MINKQIINNLKIVLDFVERWNKQDKEAKVAQAAREIEDYIEQLNIEDLKK